ncbi:Ig-like domain-containing protein, partial [Magnetovibrio sp.]|uniref:Ig-like domain-containing protein n=1 Tax=Magnetovibrio sp. TaxID=2024836 RepID=UPI002F9345AF
LQYNNGTSWVDVTLNQEITKADIDAGKLRFVPAANASGTNYDHFGFKVSDGTSYSSSAYTMQVDVTAVNDAPTAADKTLTTALNTSVVVKASDFGYSDTEGDAMTKVKITTLESNGTLQYNNGTSWVDVTLNQEITKADIDAGKLRFVPANNQSGNGYDNFKFQVHDGSTYSTSANTITFNVTPNTAPDITSNGGGSTATITVEENTTTVTTVTATDADSDTLSFSITGGEDSGKFSIDPTTGSLTFKSAPDYENPTDVGENNSYVVEVTVSDGRGGTTVQTITVNVTNVEETVHVPRPTPPAPTPTPPAPTPPAPTSPPPTIASPVVTTPITPTPTQTPEPPTETVIETTATQSTNTVMFSGIGTSQQTVQDIAISVSSSATSIAAAASTQATAQATATQATNQTTAQDSLDTGQAGQDNGADGPGRKVSAIQSYVISAKDNSGAGKVTVSVEEGLPAWMRIETDGATGTMILKGERPDDDTSTYQVKIKMKRLDGQEVDAVISIEPVVLEGDVSGAGQPQGANQGDTGQSAEEGGQPGPQASLEWMQQLLAALDGEQDGQGEETQVDGPMLAHDGFSDQLAAGRLAKDIWQERLIQA